jgi:hypothetical protein
MQEVVREAGSRTSGTLTSVGSGDGDGHHPSAKVSSRPVSESTSKTYTGGPISSARPRRGSLRPIP